MKPIRVRVGDFRLGDKEKAAINAVLDSGRLSEGRKVHEFEKKWARFVGTKYCIATSSGSGALIAGLCALKHLKGWAKKVITTPLTYIATSSAISVTGFEPVYVDVDPETFAITPENIRQLLEQAEDPNEYGVILPVHLMGFPARMDEINEIAEEYGLVVFEDSAQAHGTMYNGKKTGALSLLADFSFYIAHNIQAGEMGAITTDDAGINRLVRKIKAQGRSCGQPSPFRPPEMFFEWNHDDRFC
ncbi:MAG: DegT/DnrJ/EryC1/StrS family aminotransferase [Chloroflexota bacterium]